MRPGEHALRVERMVHGGVGVARLRSGEVVLVEGALPGEEVRVEVERRKGVLRGRTVEVVAASPDRVEPPLHPGLDYGHSAYARQLAIKGEVVEGALRRAFGLAPDAAQTDGFGLGAVVPSPDVWRYRNVVQPAVTWNGDTA